jgi:hypothetical protein
MQKFVLYSGRLVFVTFVVALISTFFIFSCKKKDSPPPDPYTYDSEIQSSLDISYASNAVSDLFALSCILSSSHDLFYTDHYYMPSQASTETVTLMYNIQTSTATIAFDNTECLDGKLRAGAAILNFDYTYRHYPEDRAFLGTNFESHLKLINYKVDEWRISLADTAVPLFVKIIDARAATLSWQMTGKLQITHINDPSRNLLFDVSFIYTAEDRLAFHRALPGPTPWATAKLQHSGTLTGTRGNEQFTYTINTNAPLVRDMSCSVTVPGKPAANAFHPYISGVSEFIIGSRHPRTISCGGETGCNNNGIVGFAGEIHTLTFD